jgi:hypothetical protein
MSEGFFSRGFRGRRRPAEQGTQLPPGQYLVDGFPILSAGPTPHTPLDEWDFAIVGEVDEPTAGSIQVWTGVGSGVAQHTPGGYPSGRGRPSTIDLVSDAISSRPSQRLCAARR